MKRFMRMNEKYTAFFLKHIFKNKETKCQSTRCYEKKFHVVNKFQVDIAQRDWLRNSGWDQDKENMILIHGYGGAVDALPMSVLRDGKNV